MAQPAAQFQPRELVRSVPFSTPKIYVGTLAAGATLNATIDVAVALSDRNLLGYSAPNGPLLGTGFFLDGSFFSDQASTLDVRLLASPTAGSSRSVMAGGTPLVVPASTLSLVAGLRCAGTFVSVDFKNTAGVQANIEFFAAVRSL